MEKISKFNEWYRVLKMNQVNSVTQWDVPKENNLKYAKYGTYA